MDLLKIQLVLTNYKPVSKKSEIWLFSNAKLQTNPDKINISLILILKRGTGQNYTELLLDNSPFPSTTVAKIYPNSVKRSLQSQILISNLTTGQYYWQLRSVNSGNITSLSAIQTFTVCVNTPPM